MLIWGFFMGFDLRLLKFLLEEKRRQGEGRQKEKKKKAKMGELRQLRSIITMKTIADGVGGSGDYAAPTCLWSLTELLSELVSELTTEELTIELTMELTMELSFSR
uniref:Uncharacterized protein n=1 Tax=Romanomermis culicivorax TaxID=13658 RepID=A0A915HMM8_ROMCU